MLESLEARLSSVLLRVFPVSVIMLLLVMKNPEVIRIVVKLVPILMVNYFPRLKLPAKLRLSDYPVN